MLFPDLGDALNPPHTRHPGQRGVMACQPRPRQRTWLQRASRQLQGQGGREKKTLWCLLSMCVRIVCAMTCGGGPTQPTYHHHSITALHQCTQARVYHSCCAQCNHETLGVRLNCGREVPDVAIPHYRDARMQHSKVDNQHSLG